MIRLPVHKEIDDSFTEWPKDSMFEYTRFGEKVMIYPRNEIWVKDCLTGDPVKKDKTYVYRRDSRDNFFYVKKDNTEPIDEGIAELIPSRWDEDQN